jgi:hypothetical protein
MLPVTGVALEGVDGRQIGGPARIVKQCGRVSVMSQLSHMTLLTSRIPNRFESSVTRGTGSFNGVMAVRGCAWKKHISAIGPVERCQDTSDHHTRQVLPLTDPRGRARPSRSSQPIHPRTPKKNQKLKSSVSGPNWSRTIRHFHTCDPVFIHPNTILRFMCGAECSVYWHS